MSSSQERGGLSSRHLRQREHRVHRAASRCVFSTSPVLPLSARSSPRCSPTTWRAIHTFAAVSTGRHRVMFCVTAQPAPMYRRGGAGEVVAKLSRSRFSRPIPAKKSAHGIASVCGTFFEVRVFGGSATASMRRPCGLERLSEETRHHTRVVRIFPNAESCLPWERGLPGRIEKSRQGCRRWQGGLSSQTHCLSHDNVFAQLDGPNAHWRGHPGPLAARRRRAHGRRMEAVAKLGRARFSSTIHAKKSLQETDCVGGTFFEVPVFGSSATASMRRPYDELWLGVTNGVWCRDATDGAHAAARNGGCMAVGCGGGGQSGPRPGPACARAG